MRGQATRDKEKLKEEAPLGEASTRAPVAPLKPFPPGRSHKPVLLAPGTFLRACLLLSLLGAVTFISQKPLAFVPYSRQVSEARTLCISQ